MGPYHSRPRAPAAHPPGTAPSVPLAPRRSPAWPLSVCRKTDGKPESESVPRRDLSRGSPRPPNAVPRTTSCPAGTEQTSGAVRAMRGSAGSLRPRTLRRQAQDPPRPRLRSPGAPCVSTRVGPGRSTTRRRTRVAQATTSVGARRPPQRSTWNIPLYQSGRLVGTPSRRGQRSSGLRSSFMTTALVSPTTAETAGENPRVCSPSSGQRSAVRTASAPGGSVTTSRPPSLRNPTAHSAVVGGGPNERATTTPKDARSPVSRANLSARPHATWIRVPTPSRTTASRRKVHRRRWESSSVPWASGHATARTRPGRPPPEPRSRNRPTGAPTTAARSSACSN